MALSEKEYSIIEHSLGMSFKETISKEYYRNRYLAGAKQENYQLLCDMRDKGLLNKGICSGELDMFFVTPVGIQLFEDQFKSKK